jgi:hypothetical protein
MCTTLRTVRLVIPFQLGKLPRINELGSSYAFPKPGIENQKGNAKHNERQPTIEHWSRVNGISRIADRVQA